MPAKPLAKERWAGGVDAVGSTTFANLLSMTRYGGAVAACGLAGGMDLPGSVAPFILRAVCLYGIDSVMCPLAKRKEAWTRLETDLDRQKLAQITSEIPLSGVFDAAPRILAGAGPRAYRGQNRVNAFRICRRTPGILGSGPSKAGLTRSAKCRPLCV